jgi:hypothetical protein
MTFPVFRSLRENILDNGEMIAVAVSESGDQEYSRERGWHHAKSVPKLPYLTQWVIIRGQVFENLPTYNYPLGEIRELRDALGMVPAPLTRVLLIP